MSKKAYICGDCVFGNEPDSRACFECIYNSNFRQKNRISYNTISDGLKAGLNGSIRSKIENVVFNDPATIVFWSDSTKTVVKTQNGEEFDPEKGLAMAIAKKALGNEGNYFNEIKKWVEPYNLRLLENYIAELKLTGESKQDGESKQVVIHEKLVNEDVIKILDECTLNPCDPCVCSGARCEQCEFGYRSFERTHEIMKNLLVDYIAGERPMLWKCAERYLSFHPDLQLKLQKDSK